MSTDIDQATFTETVGKRFGALAFMDDEFTRQWLSGYLHHGSAVCPECHKAMASGSGEKRFRQFQRVKCPSCGKFFTAATGTWLSGSKLDPRQEIKLADGTVIYSGWASSLNTLLIGTMSKLNGSSLKELLYGRLSSRLVCPVKILKKLGKMEKSLFYITS